MPPYFFQCFGLPIIIIMMKQMGRSIQDDNAQQSSRSCYKETQRFHQNEPDLYLILGCKIFPLHKVLANQSGLISGRIKADDKVIIIQKEIEIQLFQIVLDFLYGISPNFLVKENTEKLLLLARFLQIPELQQLCVEEFKQNFEDYSFFELYKFSIKHEITQLVEKCQQELFVMEYEQINFNRADLIQLPREVFQKVIRNHQNLKANKTITGLPTNEIMEAIGTYSEHNDCEFVVEELMKPEYHVFQLSRSKIERKPRVVKSQSLFVNKLNYLTRSINNFKSCEEFTSSGRKIFFHELEMLNNMNSDQEKGNQRMLDQIKHLKDEILDPNDSGITLEEISKRLLSFEKMCASHNKKFEEFKNQMTDSQYTRSKNFSTSSQTSEEYNQNRMEEVECQTKMEFSLQTTNPSESQAGSGSLNLFGIPKMERDFAF